jgi:hypothetical protein
MVARAQTASRNELASSAELDASFGYRRCMPPWRSLPGSWPGLLSRASAAFSRRPTRRSLERRSFIPRSLLFGDAYPDLFGIGGHCGGRGEL